MLTFTSLRLPVLYDPSASTTKSGPTVSWLCSKPWKISRSTLPMWSDKRNCIVTYTELKADSKLPQVDDLVTYLNLGDADAVKPRTIHAINTQWPGNPAGWSWQGVGWILGWIRCEWEIFGYGELSDGSGEWMIMHFRKTWLSPEGLDLFVRGGKQEIGERDYGAIVKKVRDMAGNRSELVGLLDDFKVVAP